MKQQVIEDVNIMPQLDKACGLDMHKDKIVGFISVKMAAIKSLGNLRLTPVNSKRSGTGYKKAIFTIA